MDLPGIFGLSSKALNATARPSVKDSQYQLDASALLALIRSEPGSDVVSDRLDRSQIHAVNLAETYRVMIRNGVTASDTTRFIAELQIPVDQQLSADQA